MAASYTIRNEAKPLMWWVPLEEHNILAVDAKLALNKMSSLEKYRLWDLDSNSQHLDEITDFFNPRLLITNSHFPVNTVYCAI